MQMRSGRQSGAANKTDYLADMHRRSGLHLRADFGKMRVHADQGVVVLDPDAAAEPPVPVGELDLAVANRFYRCAVAGRQVHPRMGAEAMQDWMVTRGRK